MAQEFIITTITTRPRNLYLVEFDYTVYGAPYHKQVGVYAQDDNAARQSASVVWRRYNPRNLKARVCQESDLEVPASGSQSLN